MRGKTLQQLLTMLQEETGKSTNAAIGQNEIPRLKRLLQRTQEFLWTDYSWPFLRVDRDEPLFAGSRYYDFDNMGLDFNRVEAAWVLYNGTWEPIKYGINPLTYNAVDSDVDEREDPVTHWFSHESGYEVWPVPATNDLKIRFRGIRNLNPLVANEDKADLDDNLIVLYAASELLAGKGDKAAQAMRAMADKHYLSLKANSQKATMFVSGGGLSSMSRPMIGPLYGKRQG